MGTIEELSSPNLPPKNKFKCKRVLTPCSYFLKTVFITFSFYLTCKEYFVRTYDCASEARVGQRFRWGEVADACKQPHGCWELNLGSLEEQPVLLTTEPILQPCFLIVKFSPFLSDFWNCLFFLNFVDITAPKSPLSTKAINGLFFYPSDQ